METESNSATNLSSLLGQNVDSQRATMVSILSEGLLTAFLAIQKLNEQIQQLRRTIGVSEGQSVNRSENIQESINLQTSAIIMLQSQLDAAKSNLTAAGSGPVEFVPSTIAAYPKLLNQRTTFDLLKERIDQLATIVSVNASQASREAKRFDMKIEALRANVAQLQTIKPETPAFDITALKEIREKLDATVNSLGRKADTFELSKKADLCDLEKLLAMFLSGDQVLVGKSPIRPWKCMSCDRRLLSVNAEAGGKDPMKSMSRRQFSRHFAGRSVSVLPPVNLRYLADSSRTLHSHSSMICQVSNCHGHERTSSNESCLGQMNDTRVKQNNANDDYYNACDTETTLQTQNVLLTQSNKVNVIKQNYSKFSCLNKPSLGPNTV